MTRHSLWMPWQAIEDIQENPYRFLTIKGSTCHVAAVRRVPLSCQGDAISGPYNTFNDDRTVDTSLVVVQPVDGAEHVRVLSRCIRVERDHLAARIAVSDGD